MIFASATQFYIYLWVNARLVQCLNRFLNVKALLEPGGAFSVIVKSDADIRVGRS